MLDGDAETIVVVSGVPRSGTSLMMSMLEAAGLPLLADSVREADESNPGGYFELEAVKSTHRDAGWVDDAPGHAVKVIHGLLRALPLDRTYRVILMERDLDDVVRSQGKMLQRKGWKEQDPAPGRLEGVYAAQLDEARALLEREPCFEWIEVSYAELLAAPGAGAERIASFLGLPAAAAPMANRVDPELDHEGSAG